jgi:hypothetical protein
MLGIAVSHKALLILISIKASGCRTNLRLPNGPLEEHMASVNVITAASTIPLTRFPKRRRRSMERHDREPRSRYCVEKLLMARASHPGALSKILTLAVSAY